MPSSLITLFIFFAIIACGTSGNVSQKAPVETSETADSLTPQHPTSTARPIIRKEGYVIPIFFDEVFKDALKAAELEMGPKSHGIWFWDRDGKFYDLKGKEFSFDSE